jgi:hypothetical protein
MLFVMAGFMWYFYFIFLGGEAERRLILKVLLMVGAILLAGNAVRYAGEDEWCIAGLHSIFALLMALAAVFAL